MIFGEKYMIEKVNDNIEKPIIDHEQKKIMINPENPKHQEQIIKQLKHLLKNRVKKIIDEYSAETGFKPERIIVRRQKTKWRSRSGSGEISLNLKLVCLLEE